MSDGADPIPEEGEQASQPWYRRVGPRRKLLLPIFTLAFLIAILVAFHTILLPFIFACVIVYLMEPVVRRLSARLPRWAAVILVYVAFFGVLTVGFIFVVPRFVSEIVRFAETVPETVAEFRQKNLPGINDRVQAFFKNYLPMNAEPDDDSEVARRLVHDAWQDASHRAAATAVAEARGRAAADMNINVQFQGQDGQLERSYKVVPRAPNRLKVDFYATHGDWKVVGSRESPVVRLVPERDGSYDVYLSRGQVEVVHKDEGVWNIRRPSPTPGRDNQGVKVQSVVDLEARLNDVIESAINASHERLASLISYAQTLVVGIIQALVAIILTFMVAAFISIDLPSFTGFFREMVPRAYRGGYDELLGRMDKGLSGVVRGQLLICSINGLFTYVGLALLGVKFSLLLGVVAGVLSLIPIFGTILSTVPIVIMGLTNSFATGVASLVLVLGIHFVEANILNPQIIGNSAHIHPVIVIFALLAGESAFGLVGALLAVPVASILLELFKFTRDKVRAADQEDGSEPPDAGVDAQPDPAPANAQAPR